MCRTYPRRRLPGRSGHRYDADRAGFKLVSQITGCQCNRQNKAVVGANAFAHESGIHQDGVLQTTAGTSTEIMRARQDVGWTQNKLVLGNIPAAILKTRLAELSSNLPATKR